LSCNLDGWVYWPVNLIDIASWIYFVDNNWCMITFEKLSQTNSQQLTKCFILFFLTQGFIKKRKTEYWLIEPLNMCWKTCLGFLPKFYLNFLHGWLNWDDL
jgi:hypothetical protein